jgi:hypothetical protein
MPGEDLQRLAEVIERAIHDDGNVLLESPKRLPDKDTGRLREHDVVLTFMQHHHKFMMALECRDRSRKVGVPDAEAFYAECQRMGIDPGIIVWSTGFTRTALQKAAATTVRACELGDRELSGRSKLSPRPLRPVGGANNWDRANLSQYWFHLVGLALETSELSAQH